MIGRYESRLFFQLLICFSTSSGAVLPEDFFLVEDEVLVFGRKYVSLDEKNHDLTDKCE
jgi:hypothetical protein